MTIREWAEARGFEFGSFNEGPFIRIPDGKHINMSEFIAMFSDEDMTVFVFDEEMLHLVDVKAAYRLRLVVPHHFDPRKIHGALAWKVHGGEEWKTLEDWQVFREEWRTIEDEMERAI